MLFLLNGRLMASCFLKKEEMKTSSLQCFLKKILFDNCQSDKTGGPLTL
jgi:hypothetical protein